MTTRYLRFGEFRFYPQSRQLARRRPEGEDEPVTVGSRALDVLSVLLARPGELISKDEMMQVVWPGVAVEENNLTVQVSTLRRVLDAGGKGPSVIQTVPGRGYRFLSTIEIVEPEAVPAAAPAPPLPLPPPPAAAQVEARRRLGRMPAVLTGLAAAVALSWLAIGTGRTFAPPQPTLSAAILPFTVIGDMPEGARVASLLNEDVSFALGGVDGAFIVARAATQGLAGGRATPAAVGRAFNVRYMVSGRVSQMAGRTMLAVALDDTASGAAVWSGRFDVVCQGTGSTSCLDGAAVEQLGTALLDAEARRVGGRPLDTLSSAELMAEVDASHRHAVGMKASARDVARLERLLVLEPDSAPVMIKLGLELLRPALRLDAAVGAPGRLRRAEALAVRARAIAPSSPDLLMLQAQLLRAADRWEEARAAFAALLVLDPQNSFLANQLAICLRALGRADESAAVLRQALAANPKYVDNWALQTNLAYALFQLGQYAEVVPLSLAAMQSAPAIQHLQRIHLAAAYALLERTDDAAHEIALLRRTLPWPSVHTLVRTVIDPPETRLRLAQGLEKAGVPEYIDERSQGSDPPVTGLRVDVPRTLTPVGAPGIETLSTDEVRGRFDGVRPGAVVVTTCRCTALLGRDAVKAPRFRHGVPVSDAERNRLRHWLEAVSKGNRDAPVVVVGSNAASWVPRNLALSAAGLGWRNVAWYRGGMDAWEAAHADPS